MTRPPRQRAVDEAGAEDDGEHLLGIEHGISERERAGEGFGDEDEWSIVTQLSFDLCEELIVRQSLIGRVGDDPISN